MKQCSGCGAPLNIIRNSDILVVKRGRTSKVLAHYRCSNSGQVKWLSTGKTEAQLIEEGENLKWR